ncbi:hypothetical protein ALT1545_110042 [Alteromonas macleodii]
MCEKSTTKYLPKPSFENTVYTYTLYKQPVSINNNIPEVQTMNFRANA